MSYSAFVSTSKARIRSSAENCARQRLAAARARLRRRSPDRSTRDGSIVDDQQVARQPRQLADDEPQVVAGLDRLRRPARTPRRRPRAPPRRRCRTAGRGAPARARSTRRRRRSSSPAKAMTWSNALCASRMLPSPARATSISAASSIVDLLGVGDPAQLIGDRLDADRLQLEDLRARLDRRRDLLDLGRRHHEDDVRRRLFDRLQQRVEGLVREPVDLVDDEDLVAVADRRHAEAGDDDLADLVDLGVGRGVDLEDVDVAALRDLDAGVAHAARDRRSAPSRSSGRAPGSARSSSCRRRAGRRRRTTARCGCAAIALRSVCVTPRWPITSSKRCGRHLRARTW